MTADTKLLVTRLSIVLFPPLIVLVCHTLLRRWERTHPELPEDDQDPEPIDAMVIRHLRGR
jgi:hypothetical protein